MFFQDREAIQANVKYELCYWEDESRKRSENRNKEQNNANELIKFNKKEKKIGSNEKDNKQKFLKSECERRKFSKKETFLIR